MQWHTQEGSINTNIKGRIYSILPELSANKILTWNCHVDDSTKGRYDMILGRYLLTALGLNLKFSDCVIEADDEAFKGSTSSMVDLGTYEFKYLNTGNIRPDECVPWFGKPSSLYDDRQLRAYTGLLELHPTILKAVGCSSRSPVYARSCLSS